MRRAFLVALGAALAAVSMLAAGPQAPAGAPAPPAPQAGAGPPAAPQAPQQQIILQTPPMPLLPNDGLGETDQPLIPGQRWRIRDLNRPKPATVTPGTFPGQPPSDAVVLFDGKDLSRWQMAGGGRGRAGGGTAGAAAATAAPSPAPGPAAWKVENGYVEVTPGAGSITTRERFRDYQLHLEFATPAIPMGTSQYRGNSGISIGGREIQILDNYDNATYADGYAGAVYNQWPPLANAARPPGEWQTFDIAYMAARYEGDRLVRNAFITIFQNGVMIHNNREIFPPAPRGGRAGAAGAAGRAGAGPGRGAAAPPASDQPITLMGHPSAVPGNAIRYRNIWIRPVEVELPTAPAAPAGQ